MDVSLALKTPPAIEPVLLDVAINLLKITGLDEDGEEADLIERYISAAREEMEEEYTVVLIDQTWTQRMSRFPSADTIELRRRPLKSVTSVKYRDADNVLQTFASADYLVQKEPVFGLIELKPDKSWPTSTYDRLDAVEIEFVAGYGAAGTDVPKRLYQELLLRLSEKYEHRGEMMPENFKRHPAIGAWASRVVHV